VLWHWGGGNISHQEHLYKKLLIKMCVSFGPCKLPTYSSVTSLIFLLIVIWECAWASTLEVKNYEKYKEILTEKKIFMMV
jgi:hypothetical protein